MDNRLGALGLAIQTACAANQDFTVMLLYVRTTNRTVVRNHDIPDCRAALFEYDFNNFGNDIPCSPDDHLVTDFHIQPANLIHVMQGCITDRYPANENRFESGNRRDSARPANLKFHII